MAKKKKAARKSAMKKGTAKKAKKPAKKKPAAKKAAARKSMIKKAVARKSPARKAAKRKMSPRGRKRELINTGTDKRYVRRDEVGQFRDVVDVSRSLAADVRQPALFDVPVGQGDKGD
jgi:hypothetical protein